jgi:heptosyltransferase-2
VKPGGLGDVLMCMPAVREYRQRHPGCRVTWIIDARLHTFVAQTALADELVDIDLARVRDGSRTAAMGQVLRAWRRLAGRRFDHAFIAYRDRRYRLFAAASRVGRFSSLETGAPRPWLLPGRHHSDEYARALLGEPESGLASVAPLALRVARSAAVDALLQPLRGEPFVVLAVGIEPHPRGDGMVRRGPDAHFVSLIARLRADGIATVVVGTAERSLPGATYDDRCINAIGRTDLLQFADLLGRAAVVVAPDGGTMHMASAVGVPVVALFGPTTPSEKAPRSARSRVLWGGETLACRPCYDGFTYAVCASVACMAAITPQRVADEVAGILRAP